MQLTVRGIKTRGKPRHAWPTAPKVGRCLFVQSRRIFVLRHLWHTGWTARRSNRAWRSTGGQHVGPAPLGAMMLLRQPGPFKVQRDGIHDESLNGLAGASAAAATRAFRSSSTRIVVVVMCHRRSGSHCSTCVGHQHPAAAALGLLATCTALSGPDHLPARTPQRRNCAQERQWARPTSSLI